MFAIKQIDPEFEKCLAEIKRVRELRDLAKKAHGGYVHQLDSDLKLTREKWFNSHGFSFEAYQHNIEKAPLKWWALYRRWAYIESQEKKSSESLGDVAASTNPASGVTA